MERYRAIRPTRHSVRSRESSISSNDPKEKVKDCCRKLVAFMCTQVGVGGLVVGYAIVGAIGFIAVESEDNSRYEDVLSYVNESVNALWDVTVERNVFNESKWRHESNLVLLNFTEKLVDSVKSGYVGRTSKDIWTFPAAMMFCLSIFTMIGYGNVAPRTELGRALTVVYAVIGIPLYVLYFMNMGKILASTFRWLYTRIFECTTDRRQTSLPGLPRPRVIVPSTACLWVMGGYVLTGAIVFSQWEGWHFLDSVYFCVTSLCKIGIGDFVPGQRAIRSGKENQDLAENHTKLIINFVYLLLGMGLVAMCYNLMREEVRVRVREVKQHFRLCLDDIQFTVVSCYRGPPAQKQ